MKSNILAQLPILQLSLLPLLSSFDLSLQLKLSLLLDIDLKMVSTAIKGLESLLGSNASQDTVVDDGNTIAEDICLFHGVSGEDHSSFTLEISKDIPKLSPVLWIESGRGLIKIDDLGV